MAISWLWGQFLWPNINLIFLKIIFLSEYQIRRPTFVNNIFNFNDCLKVYLAKMCPIFDDSASNCLTRYQKILWVCSLGSKNLLNFTCLTMKFHDRNYVNAGSAVYAMWHTDLRCQTSFRIFSVDNWTILDFRSVCIPVGEGQVNVSYS